MTKTKMVDVKTWVCWNCVVELDVTTRKEHRGHNVTYEGLYPTELEVAEAKRIETIQSKEESK